MAPFIEVADFQIADGGILDSTEVCSGDGMVDGHDTNANNQSDKGIHRKRSSQDAPRPAPPEPIAICGMSVRLPGAVHTPQELWNFLISKRDARGPVPESRYNVSAYHSETAKPGSVSSEYGYFLDESIDLASIDTSFFTMGKSEAERVDPQQRQMLEVARECLEDAGEVNWKGKPIGCFMGSFGEDWVEMFAKENQQYGQHRATGHGDFMLANRVSYEMDLTGPSMVIRTACSAALVALHEACLALSRGDCEAAIIGGANLILGPGMTTSMAEQGVLSPDGSCKTFSADANGYARGEGISAIFIKPLANALRDNNPIRAVIRATASASDGRGTSSGISVPNDVSQEALIRRAYEIAGISDYSETAFFECHGTGTPVGDPIEARAVGRVFGPSGGILIGSAKPNFGHSEGASGLTSLIKSVLALEHRVIPPNIKFGDPNPAIPWDEFGLSVPTEPSNWPESRRERISVNSFGIGGTDAHVILDSAHSFGISPVSECFTIEPQLLLYSANNVESLNRMSAIYKTYSQKNSRKVSDLAFTLSHRREHLIHRAFAIKNALGTLTTSAPSKSGDAPAVVMVFTGQGAQWPQMGGGLFHSPSYPVFKETIRSLDQYLQTLDPAPKWSIEDELLRGPEHSKLGSAEISQPLCTAIQIALVDVFASVGVQASAVVGHSSGEVAAAYAAGALTANEAITIAFYRGQVTRLQTKPGAMAAIGMGADTVQQYLKPGVIVACENSPRSVTLAGDAQEVEEVVASIKEGKPDLLARKLQVDKAYHSHHMVEIGEQYHALIEPHVTAKDAQVLFFSSVENAVLTQSSEFGPKYWQKNLESPVLFYSAIESIIQHDIAKNMMFLEIGPHSALAGPLRQIQAHHSTSFPYVSALTRNQHDVESFLTAVGTLYSLNASLDLKRLIPRGRTLPDLPRYPWDHSKRFWYESRLSKEWRCREYKYHDLLGVRVTESFEFDILFRNLFHLDNAPWIRDHKVGDDVIFPFAGYAAMAGEAVRQATGMEQAFKLRDIIVSTALVLNDGPPVEIMTSLRPHRLTDSLDSEWWEFTIASYNGTLWTKHCSGEVRSQTDDFGAAPKTAPFVRKVAKCRCYESMARSGLNFGNAFQRLEEIRSDTLSQKASSEVLAKETDGNEYHLHPTVIDASLQLLSVAASKGYTTSTTKIMVPTNIKEMCIYRCHKDVQVRASASNTPNGSIIGSGQCISAGGKLVLRSSGVRLSVIDDQESEKSGDLTALVKWGPHIDFLDVSTLIKPVTEIADSMDRCVVRASDIQDLTELSHLCMIHTKRTLGGLETTIPHMLKFRSWIDHHLQNVDVNGLECLEETVIDQRVKRIVNDLSQTAAADFANAIYKINSQIKKIFVGAVEPLDLLVADETLTGMYHYMDRCDESEFYKHLTHSKPNLRVLEIGSGTGGSTAKVLRLLKPDNKALYSTYTFTDISSGFFVAAKKRFESYPNIEYKTLDISKDPSEQGFEDHKYDLILATNVIHATESLQTSLCHIRNLLEPNGRLLLTELTSTSKWVNYIWGPLAGWWYGDSEGRSEEPYISLNQWETELKVAGFRTPDAAVRDSASPYEICSVIVARPDFHIQPTSSVTLLTLSSESEQGKLLLRSFEAKGYRVHCCTLQDMSLPTGQDVIALLDEHGPFFENIGDLRFSLFKELIQSLEERGIFWVTQLSQIHCQDPRFGQIHGIARTTRSELLVDFATCEVDNFESSSNQLIEVFQAFQVRQESETFKPELEYAIVQNTVRVGRIHSFSTQEETAISVTTDSITLRTSKAGRLGALHWTRQEMAVLKDTDVEIETYATGLNFKDVLCAMGIVEAADNSFGLEAAGVVRRLGPDVQNLSVGDRVLLIGRGGFGTRVVVSENLCEKIPGGLSFEDAATMPCVFATSFYSLFTVGNLQRGQSILIHSACGGVGIATIQLAQMVGAEIYATVGSEKKVQYLMETFGLPRNRIFNSRNTSFVEDLMRETGGEGVDLALNSLSGELLHATWGCVAEFGKLVEIGKRDLIGSGKLDMSIFEANRSYCCVDLDHICVKRPKVVKKLLQNIISLLRERHIHPIRPIKVFKSDEILDAFRYMQQGVHLGKIVVSMLDISDHASSPGAVQQRRKETQFDESGAYLLVGGLGGIGRSISTWMVEHGARHIIYLSRTAGTTEAHQDFSQELSSMGCRVQFVQGSVVALHDVIKAISQAHGRLKGILQMSMTLRDQAFGQMTLESWNAAVDPKVKGTWNLHSASMSIQADLDFFVLFSSLSGVIGTPGQVNYAGANSFLDAFADYRRGLGLVASSIQIGAVDGIGYLSEHDSVKQKLTGANLGSSISENELLEVLPAVMTPIPTAVQSTTKTSFMLGLRSNTTLSSPANRCLWKKDVRMASFHNYVEADIAASSASNDSLKSFIATAKGDASLLGKSESIEFLAAEIGRKIFNFLLKPEEDLQTTCTLSDLGMDSLVAIEVRQWWKSTFGFDISVLEMMGMGTLYALGEHASRGMLSLFHGEN
ncbi:unnamed protein product [Penicillium salamii]|nr:unnamed protein product [Penicillium salamii]CAG8397271.1 unnamed protein product [Penicillium salamii]